jgi:hypothetical protein
VPLDNPQKIAHIQAIQARIMQGRTRNVVFVYQATGTTTYTYSLVSVIWRVQELIDPEIPAAAGNAPGVPFDMQMVCPISTSFTGLVYVADATTATAGAVAAARKYELIEAVPTGIIPGGTHVKAILRRLR